MFADRIDAGGRLGEALAARDTFDETALVLGIPRGGVIVARRVADRLGTTLDVVVPHKLGAPYNAELAIGAVTIDGTVVVDRLLLAALAVPDGYVEAERERQVAEIARRLEAYRGSPDEADPAGRACVVVDDGMATGATAEAAVRSLRSRGASLVALAVPVASRQAVERLGRVADDVVCLAQPHEFLAVGQWFLDFGQVSDEEVVAALRGPDYHRAP